MSQHSAATSAIPAPKISLSLKKSVSKPVKRPHSALAEDDDDDNPKDKSQQISHFDATSNKPAPAPPRVIPSLPNRNWREETAGKRQRSSLPTTQRTTTQTNGTQAQDIVNGDAPAGGLMIVERHEERTSASPPPPSTTNRDDGAAAEDDPDREALDALMGKRAPTTTTIAPPSPPPTEDEAFKQSYNSAPQPATLEEYNATPVEGFGAAILRGYLKEGETLEGWSEKQSGKVREVKKRPGLLGLGAKESGMGVELGAWGKGAKGQAANGAEAGYVPLAMKNKKTGEMVTEQELKEKVVEQEKMDKEGARERKRRDEDDRASDRDRDRDRDRRRDDSSRKHSSRRDRHDYEDDRDSKGYHRRDRSRHRDSEDDRDRHRRREKDRDRERTKDRDRDRHRDSHKSSRR